MEGLGKEGQSSAISAEYNQDQVGGGDQNNGKKKKGGGGGGGGGSGGNGDGGGGGGGGMLRTPADIYEHPTFYSFILDMPGVDNQNIKVKVENGVLHVTGKRIKMKAQLGSEEGVKAMRLERRRARYMRKFNLPSNAHHGDVKATYKDGVLTISIPKSPST